MRWALVLVAVGCGKHASVEHRDTAAASITITAVVPGASPADVESAVVNPIEDAVARVHGLAHLSTRIAGDHAVIVLELEPGIDSYATSQDVNTALATVQRSLPIGLMPPTVSIASARDRAVLRFTLRGDAPATIARWQDEVGNRALETLSGVGRIASCGGARDRWTIAIDPLAASSHGKGLDAVIESLRASTLDPQRELIDQLTADPTIRDVAVIQRDAIPNPCRAVDRAGPVVVTTIAAQPGADPLAVRETLEARLRELAPQLPPSIHLAVLPRTRPIAFAIADVTPATLDRVRAVVAAVPGVDQLVVELGGVDPATAEVRLVPADGTSESTVEAAALAALTSAHLVVRDHTQTIVKLVGPDLAQLRTLAEQVAKAFEGHVTERLGLDDAPHLDVQLDRDRLAELGVSATTVADVLRAAGDEGLAIPGARMGPPIAVTLRTPSTNLADRLTQIRVGGRNDTLVALAWVVKVSETREPTVILHDNRERWAGVRIARTADEIHAVVDKLAIPPGYRVALVAAE